MSERKLILIILLHLCISLFLSAQDFLTSEERLWLEENSPIVLGVDQGNPPMNYLDDSGELAGLNIDYINLIFKKLGQPVEFYGSTWSDALQNALDHNIDGIINASIKEDRLPYLNFTESYFQTPDALLTREETPHISGPESLAGYTVAVIRDSIRVDLLRSYSPDVVILEVDNLIQGVSAIAEGRAVGLLDEMPVVENLIDEYFLYSMKLNTLIFFPEIGGAHIGVRNDEPMLVEILDKAIDQITPQEHRQLKNAYHDRSDTPILVDPGFTEEELKWLAEHPVIRVGSDYAWEPMEFDDNGIPRGIAMDYFHILEPMLGVEFVIVMDEWKKILEMGINREVDIYSCARRTPEREEYMDFTTSYLNLPVVMLARSNLSYISNIDKLARYRLGLLEGYAATELFLLNYPHLPPNSYYDDLPSAVDGLIKGDIDVLIDNQQAINHHLSKEGIYGLQIVGDMPFSYDLGIGVRNDWPELVSIFNKALKAISPETQENIQQNWSSVTIRRELDYKKLMLLSSFFAIVFLVLLIWIFFLAKQARIRTRQLEEAKRMETIGNMAGGIAHDFKNLLMGISGYTELVLQEMHDDPEKRSYLNEILTAVDSGTDLTNRILMYSKQGDASLEECDLSKLTRQIAGLLQNWSNLDISMELDIEEGCVLVGDVTQLKQLIMNLGTNAIHAMEKRDTKILGISLKYYDHSTGLNMDDSKLKGPLICLTVSDTGTGIPQKNLGKILDPYFTTRTGDKGTGLGLATVDRIIKNHFGILHVDSVVGKGSSFSVYIPCHNP